MNYTKEIVNGLNIFYRESEDRTKPAFVLFHGFPSASHSFRGLIPLLQNDFYCIAPDYPGFGQSDAPDRKTFDYTFDNIAHIMEAFLIQKKLTSFYMYVFDYGAPVGFRIASWHPDWIKGIVSQNGNVYEEGLGKKWEARKDFWEHPTEEKRNIYRSAFASQTIVGQYTFGTEPGKVSPDGYTLDISYNTGEEYAQRQLDLIFDYRNNVKLYPVFQEYLRKYQPALLAAWGKNDPSFIYQGALAFKKDIPQARVEFLNSGHFALETHAVEIAALIKEEFS